MQAYHIPECQAPGFSPMMCSCAPDSIPKLPDASAVGTITFDTTSYVTMTSRWGDLAMTEPSFNARMGRLSSIVTILPAAMAGGWVLGYFLVDRTLGIFPWGGIAGTVFGAAAGLYEIYRLLTRDRQG